MVHSPAAREERGGEHEEVEEDKPQPDDELDAPHAVVELGPRVTRAGDFDPARRGR